DPHRGGSGAGGAAPGLIAPRGSFGDGAGAPLAAGGDNRRSLCQRGGILAGSATGTGDQFSFEARIEMAARTGEFIQLAGRVAFGGRNRGAAGNLDSRRLV